MSYSLLMENEERREKKTWKRSEKQIKGQADTGLQDRI